MRTADPVSFTKFKPMITSPIGNLRVRSASLNQAAFGSRSISLVRPRSPATKVGTTTPAEHTRQPASIMHRSAFKSDTGRRSKLLNSMHILRESALLPVDAPKTTHGAFGGKGIRAAMSIHAHILVTADPMATGRLARHGAQELDLSGTWLVVMAMVTVFGSELAAIRVKVVHVAHLDGLDALNLLPVSEVRRIDALAFLVVT
jgi:hypothetical protein